MMSKDAQGSGTPWNKGRLIGPKPPLKPKHVWGIRIRLRLTHATRDLATFDLAIDSKLRGCDLVRLRISSALGHPSLVTQTSRCGWRA